MKYLFMLAFASFFFSACRKESVPDPPPIMPPDTPVVYVPIYNPGDTSLGAGYAKKLGANWKAESFCAIQSVFDTNYISIIFFTYSGTGAIRESIGFNFIPRFKENETYGLKYMTGSTFQQGYVSTSYATWRSDGDLLEDYYNLDTTAQDNFFKVTTIDLANKRMEGTFTVTFKIKEPRKNPINPKTVKFSNGTFWAVIRD